MQGSFEKKVQEKLDELKMHPSAPVWEKIEVQLDPEKKRRRGFFWIPLAACLLTGAGWFFFNNTKQQKTDVVGSTITTSNTTTSSIEKKQAETTRKESSVVMEEPVAPAFETKKNLPVTVQKRQGFTASPRHNSQLGIVAIERSSFSSKRVASAGKTEKDISTSDNTINEHTITEPAEVQQKNKGEEVTPISQQDQLPVATDSTKKEEKPVAQPLPLAATDSSTKKGKVALQSKWRKTVTVQAGWNKPSSSLFTTDRFAPVSNTGTQTGTNSQAFAGANTVKGGTSFTIGAGVEKAVGKRTVVSVGLQYSFHRMHTRVGAFRRMDTSFTFSNSRLAVGGYYRNGNSADYTINYHLLEVPVSIGYKVFSSLPLTLSAGAAYGRLLKSNALTYNAVTNSYYYNRENITKHYVSLFSSLQYNVINRQRLQVGLGPVVYYHLSSLQKQPAGNPVRLSFAGLKTSIVF